MISFSNYVVKGHYKNWLYSLIMLTLSPVHLLAIFLKFVLGQVCFKVEGSTILTLA